MNPRSNFVSFCAIFAIAASLSFIGANRVWGQGATASILGTVTDMTGAAVPDTSIQITNTQTGISQTVTSDAAGRFRVLDLAVGDYDAQASKPGFTTVVHKGVTLTVGSQTVVDFSLAVGQTQQTVTVEGQATAVETTNAAIGSYTSQQQMTELPLNGRNFEQLVYLSPGVAPIAFSTTALQGRALEYSIAGSRPEGQAILLDDENLQNFWNNGMGSVSGSSLGVEAIREFQTLTNAYGAQFGGNGAVVNAVSKSGTNEFHGSAFDYLRNSAMDARDFFAGFNPAFRRNQFGGSLGGPIKKDKFFFFVDYEGIRQLLEEDKVATVPNCADIVNGSSICAPSASLPAIQQEAIANTIALYPKPTILASPTTGTVTEYGNQTDHENYGLFRLDYTFSDSDSIFLRYYIDKTDFVEPFGGAAITGGGAIPLWHEADQGTNHFSTLEERHLFSPTVVNLARLSFSRPTKSAYQTTIAGLVNGVPTAVPIGSQLCGNTNTYCPLTPLQYWPGFVGNYDGLFEPPGGTYTDLGGAAITAFNLVQNRYTVGDDILWTKGAHGFRFGVSVAYSQANTVNNLKQDALWVVNSPPFGQPPFANFVAGKPFTDVEGVIPGASQYGPTYGNRDYRQTDFDPYVQDDWKATRKLTVNLGLRWEFYTNPTTLRPIYELVNIQSATAFTQFNNVFASNPSLHDFDPRIGIAYDPFADHKTSIRAGFGIFHDPITGLDYQIGLQTNPPWLDNIYYNAPGYPTPFANGLAGALPTATQGWNRYTNSTPYVEQYNFNIQREIIPNTVLTLAYVGSHGVHLFTGIDGNPPIPTVTSNGLQFGTEVSGSYVANPRINPNFGAYTWMEPISTSNYNSLQVMLNRRFSQNFQMQLNYTYSKCLDNGGFGVASLNAPNGGTITPASLQNPYDQHPDYGLCSFDLTNVLRVNGLYALPFHQNRLVSGWQITGIISDYSGVPFTVGTGFSNSVDPGGDSPRANYVYGCNPYQGAQTRLEWFNPNCYTTPAPGFLGDVGRDTLRAPPFFDMDIAVLKDTKLTERTSLQFRAEFFNILNHENFAPPNSVPASPSAPTAGEITATNPGSTPRQIQFALKLRF